MKFSIIKQMLLSFYSGVYVCTGKNISKLKKFTGVMLAIFLSTGMPYLGVQAFLTAFGLCSGLVMSGLTGSALFTEQNVILPVNLVKFRKSVFKTMRFWIISFIGNCVGCAFMGFMFNLALCVRNNEIQQRLGSILNSKLQHMEFGTFGWWGILLSGILGNTILGTGVIMGNMSRDVPGKVIAMFIGVVSFVATGTDHCMANIGFFSIGLFHEYFFEGENFNVPRLNISNVFLWNIVPTFIGNIVGSFVFVSAAYSFIFSSNHVVKGLEKQNGPVKKELPKKPRFLSLAQTEKLLTPNVSARNSVKSPNIRSGTKKFAEISPKL
jgi:formate transporter